jgi:hypothetical protein
MDKITLTCTGGPYGDCTSSYNFTLNREMTLQEFLDLVISNEREWGQVAFSRFGDPIAEYKWGKITVLKVKDTSFKIKTTGTAHGGWSLMDYYIDKK